MRGSILCCSIRPSLLLLFLLASATGCGDSKGDVSGQVSYQGVPLPDGKITFVCEGGDKPVFQSSIRDGKYEIKRLPAGPAKITVATYPPGAAVKPPPGIGPMKPPDAEAVPPPPKAGRYVEIPRRYSQIEQSNLDYIVRPGSQVYDINLDR